MSNDTAIPIEQIGMVKPGAQVLACLPGTTMIGVDLGSHETTGLDAFAGEPGSSVHLMVQMDLAKVANPVDVVEFALFHLRQLATEIHRRMC